MKYLLLGLLMPTMASAAFQPQNKAALVAALDTCCDNDAPAFDNQCTYGDTHISLWDTSQVEDFSEVFRGDQKACMRYFNADISQWDVSSGTDFNGMFRGAYSFNQDISGWDVSSATSYATSYGGMFSFAYAFNQDLSGWNVNTDAYFTGMFLSTFSLFTDLETAWGVSGDLFYQNSCVSDETCGTCDQRRRKPNSASYLQYLPRNDVLCSVGKKANYDGVDCKAENCADDNAICCLKFQPADRAALDVALSTCCDNDAPAFDNECTYDGVHISLWDTSLVDDFSEVFNGWNNACFKHFNADISQWDVSSGTKFNSMFNGALSFNQDISGWNINPHLGWEKYEYMLENAYAFNQNLDAWNLQEPGNQFLNAKSMTKPVSWYTAPTSACFGMEDQGGNPCGTCDNRHYNSDLDIATYGLPLRLVTCSAGVKAAYAGANCGDELCADDNSICCLPACDTYLTAEACPDACAWRSGACAQTFQPADKAALEAALSTCCDNDAPAFDNECTYDGVHISLWDTSLVTSFNRLFYTGFGQNSCYKNTFNADISQWDVSSGTVFIQMFGRAYAFNQDISGWDVSSGTDFNGMFGIASSFNADISQWDVSSGTDFNIMFSQAYSFNQDISGWDVSRGMDFNGMFFWAANFNQDLSQWSVNTDADFRYMFKDTWSLTYNVETAWGLNATTGFYENSCVSDDDCGTCDARRIVSSVMINSGHSVNSEYILNTFHVPRSDVVCSAGNKADYDGVDCGENCADDNAICCETPCENHPTQTACTAASDVCWWHKDENKCERGHGGKPLRDHELRTAQAKVCDDHDWDADLCTAMYTVYPTENFRNRLTIHAAYTAMCPVN